jgi:hypothetical protein
MTLLAYCKKAIQVTLTATALLITGASQDLMAQPWEQKSHLYDNHNLKNYATDILPGSEESVMAGTVYDYNDPLYGVNDAVHFLHLDRSGGVLVSTVYASEADESVIGVHYVSRNLAIIVASRMNMPAGGGIRTRQIHVIEVDPVSGAKIYDYVIQDGSYDVYPLGTMMDGADDIYICGYQVSANTTNVQNANMATVGDPKEAVIIRYQRSTNSVVFKSIYNSSPTLIGIFTPTIPVDIDMAHRMKIVSQGIWVGGSCQDQATPSKLSMMNLVINPITGALVSDWPIDIGIIGSGWNYDQAVTSFDIIENLNGNSYVFGNIFSGVNYNTQRPQELSPYFFTITACDGSNGYKPINTGNTNQNTWQWANFDYAWGTKVLEGNTPNTVMVVGYQTHGTCESQHYSADSIRPFITELELNTSGSGNITVGVQSWSVLSTVQGTGDWTLPNSFYQLDGIKLLHAPINAVRLGGAGTDMIVSAPVWNSVTNNHLNMKYIRADQFGDVPGCANTDLCEPGYWKYKLTEGVRRTTISSGNRQRNDYNCSTINFLPDHEYTCTGNNSYKPGNDDQTNVPSLGVSDKIVIYPNPAATYVQLRLGNQYTGTEKITVTLTDLTGHTLQELYSGTAVGAAQHIALPSIAAGMYFVNIIADSNAATQTLPLSIVH